MVTLNGHRVLVTGGTGSVGRAVVLECLKRGASVSILSRDEMKQYELICDDRFDTEKIQLFIGDVRDEKAVAQAMRDVDIVFHCAAMKHVPFCELDVSEAVYTNVLGSMNVVRAAINEDTVKAVISCSTDKACNPTTTMGASKLLQERVFQNARIGRLMNKRFVCVRFGNLFESRGSVFHHFFRQREANKIYLTHAGMTRFVSTLEDAANSMMYAALSGRNGEVIIKKCKAVKMVNVAKAIAPNAQITIVGVRQNEKLDEHLYNETESLRVKIGKFKDEDYFVISPQKDETELPTQPYVAYSSNDHCIDFDSTKMLMADFAERCGYQI